MTLHALFILLLLLTSIFMIALILIQRGKGGGLAGAFGGAGGQSAFGTKAGDVFTKITIVTALIWFALCILAIRTLRTGDDDIPDLGDGDSMTITTPPTIPGTGTAPTIELPPTTSPTTTVTDTPESVTPLVTPPVVTPTETTTPPTE
ncbi:MAG: preprotein translocase subunit SecG [Planctomycetaceae bacterium]|jgi:preprotein translocase subunit SecG|nr:preprotein translocase subunit SecG [Planctomycetaceae bacterium]